jgi:hypothetical protein
MHFPNFKNQLTNLNVFHQYRSAFRDSFLITGLSNEQILSQLHVTFGLDVMQFRVLHCIPYIAVQYDTIQSSTMQCRAVQCSAVQCSAVQCRAVQCNAELDPRLSNDQINLNSRPIIRA